MLVHQDISRLLANDRIEALKRDWPRSRARNTGPRPVTELSSVALRLSRPADDRALEQLAALEGRIVPRGRFVLAEVGGRIVAALPLCGGDPVRDPFKPTVHLVRLLEVRAAQLLHDTPRRGLLVRLRRATAAG